MQAWRQGRGQQRSLEESPPLLRSRGRRSGTFVAILLAVVALRRFALRSVSSGIIFRCIFHWDNCHVHNLLAIIDVGQRSAGRCVL